MPATLTDTHPTRWWTALPDGRVRCDVCPRACALKEGQRGLCFVRARQGDAIVSTTYGRSSGYCVDPIEKKPLNHFLPGTPILSFGTAGCNLSCRFCQNWDISKSRELDTLQQQATPGMIAEAAEQLGCRSVAVTYNDPVIFMEYAMDTADACHERGIQAVAVTAGYMEAGPAREFYAHMDAANIDLKGFTDRFYRKLCAGELQPVLDLLRYLKHETPVWFEITTLLIPGENDSPEELDALTRWIATELGPDVPLHFTAFHPDYRMRDTEHTPATTLRLARETGLRNGLHHVYTGNIRDKATQSTYCHGCGARIIGRDGYQISDWNLDPHGQCRQCGTPLPGRFEARAGTWGPKRLPVRLERR
ncbi:MAG: AmmeMemoRadiSam system radical SAM enzyme [Gammaproteobacteria bacterium]